MQEDNITQPPSEPKVMPTFELPPEPAKKTDGWRSILSTVAILVAAPLIALFLTSFVFQSYEVDGPSMRTTLEDNDRLIVFKLGKSWASLTNQKFIPKRGEIVVFHKDGLYEFGDQQQKQLIKRVIALPGERVVVRDGVVTVYNDEHPDGFQPDKEGDYSDAIPITRGDLEITVPEGKVFVCGDNRGNSLDSRDFGPVSSDEIVGTLAMRIFPINKVDTF